MAKWIYNTSKGTIYIAALRDRTGVPFQLGPGKGLDMSPPHWPASTVARCKGVLARYVRIGELSYTKPKPKRAPRAPRLKPPTPSTSTEG